MLSQSLWPNPLERYGKVALETGLLKTGLLGAGADVGSSTVGVGTGFDVKRVVGVFVAIGLDLVEEESAVCALKEASCVVVDILLTKMFESITPTFLMSALPFTEISRLSC